HGLEVEPLLKLRTTQTGRRDQLEIAARKVPGDRLFVHRQCGRPRAIIVKERGGLGNHLTSENRLVSFVGFPGAMRRLLMQHEKEWLILRPRLEPLDAQSAGDVGAMPFDREFVARNEEGGIPINALARKNDPAVKACRIGTEMPFSDHARVIAGGLQMLGDMVPRSVKAIENGHAIEMRVLARK